MKDRMLKGKGYSIILLVALVSSFSFISMTKNCFSSAMVFIVQEGILTKFQTGTISAVFYIVYAILQMLCGSLTDKWHPERFITIGLVGAGVSNMIVYLNQNYAIMLFAWVINAVAQCAVWPAVFKIASSVISDRLRGVSLFTINISGSIGTICSLLLAAVVSTRWQINFLFSSVGLFIVAFLWELTFAFVRPKLTECDSPCMIGTESDSSGQTGGFWKVALPGGIILLFFIAIARSAMDLGMKALTPSLIKESYASVSAELATLVSIIVIVAGVLGTLFASLLYPRFVKNEAIAISVLLMAAFPFVCLLLLVGKVNYLMIVLFLALMVFILSAASMFTSSYIAGRFNRWNMGATVAGFVNGGAALGIVVANMLFTALADAKGWYFTIVLWIFLMAITILCSFVFLGIWTKFLKKNRFCK